MTQTHQLTHTSNGVNYHSSPIPRMRCRAVTLNAEWSATKWRGRSLIAHDPTLAASPPDSWMHQLMLRHWLAASLWITLMLVSAFR